MVTPEAGKNATKNKDKKQRLKQRRLNLEKAIIDLLNASDCVAEVKHSPDKGLGMFAKQVIDRVRSRKALALKN